MNLSIVISLFNEQESLSELISWIHSALKGKVESYEILLIDDGSNDGSWSTIQSLAKEDSTIHGIRFRRNYGKSAALYCGFKTAKGDIVVTMDADLQDDPNEIPEMIRMINKDGYDLVSGWKKIRHDNKLTKNLPSKLYMPLPVGSQASNSMT